MQGSFGALSTHLSVTPGSKEGIELKFSTTVRFLSEFWTSESLGE